MLTTRKKRINLHLNKSFPQSPINLALTWVYSANISCIVYDKAYKANDLIGIETLLW